MNKVKIINDGVRKTVKVTAFRVSTNNYFLSTTMIQRKNKAVGT